MNKYFNVNNNQEAESDMNNSCYNFNCRIIPMSTTFDKSSTDLRIFDLHNNKVVGVTVGSNSALSVVKSENKGLTFSTIATWPTPVHNSSYHISGINVHNNTIIYSGYNWRTSGSIPFVRMSTDNGNSWTILNNILPDFSTSVSDNITYTDASFSEDGKYIYLCFGSASIYKSEDYGSTWTRVLSGGGAVAKLESSGNMVMGSHTSNFNSLYLSDDYGDTWTEISNRIPGSYNPVVDFAIEDQYVYVITEHSTPTNHNKLWKSDDFGLTFVEITSTTFGNGSLGYISVSDNKVLISVFNLRISYDYGLTWTTLNNEYYIRQSKISGNNIGFIREISANAGYWHN